jgi:protein SCO1/2
MVRILLWSVVFLALIGVAVGKMLLPKPAPRASGPAQLYSTPALTLTDQDGKAFSTSALRGHVWVADFIFSSCGGSCPVMSHEMAGLQKKTPTEVDFVSFTVDPKTDTPAVLKEYGQSLHADFARWHFLTGSEQQMRDAALAMKIAVQPADGQVALSHSDRFLLVDSTGHVVGIFDGTKPDEISRLAAQATKLAAGGGAS